MQIGNYQFHRLAFMMFLQLEADEKAQVRERLLSLDGTPAAQWPATLAKKLPGDRSLYLVRIDDSLRAFVQTAPGQQPEVMDITRQETIDFMSQAAAKNGA